jgi:hypothetical protein
VCCFINFIYLVCCYLEDSSECSVVYMNK